MTEKPPSARVKLNDLLFQSEYQQVYDIPQVAQQFNIQPANLIKYLVESEHSGLILLHAPEKNQFQVIIQPNDGSIPILPPDRHYY